MKLALAICVALVSVDCAAAGAQPRGSDRWSLFDNAAPRPPRLIPHVRPHQAANVPVPRPQPNAAIEKTAPPAAPGGFPPVAPLDDPVPAVPAPLVPAPVVPAPVVPPPVPLPLSLLPPPLLGLVDGLVPAAGGTVDNPEFVLLGL